MSIYEYVILWQSWWLRGPVQRQ